MSSLIPTNIALPAHLQGRMNTPSLLNAAVAGGIGGGAAYPRLSIKGARFRVVEGGTSVVLNTIALEAVIIGANPRLSKTWYGKQWDPDSEPEAPDCQSASGIAPDADVTDPQSADCMMCPHNQWGSKITPTGQKTKACADHKRLAVVAADDPGGKVYLLNVTPAALKNLGQYQKELSARGIPVEVIRTVISFDTDASFPKLTFGFKSFLTPEELAIIDTRLGSDEVKEVTGENTVEAQPQVAHTPKPLLVAPQPKPEPKVEILDYPAPAKGTGGGFGGGTVVETTATEVKPATKPATSGFQAATAEPLPAKEVTSDALTDEIKALLEGLDSDD